MQKGPKMGKNADFRTFGELYREKQNDIMIMYRDFLLPMLMNGQIKIR